MKRALPVIALLVGLWTMDGAAQGRNFAGAWIVDTERTAAENGAAAAAGGAVTAVARGTAGGDAVATAGGGGAERRRRRGRCGRTGGRRPGRRRWRRRVRGGRRRRAERRRRRHVAACRPGRRRSRSTRTTFTIATAETSTAYKLDGSATTTETPRGNVTVKAGWKDDRIVIETTAPGAAGPMVSTTSWYLDGAALVREIECHRRGRPADRAQAVLQALVRAIATHRHTQTAHVHGFNRDQGSRSPAACAGGRRLASTTCRPLSS